MKILGISLVFLIVLACILVGPIISIWALNTLFNTGITLTIWTWLAAFWFQFLVGLITNQSK